MGNSKSKNTFFRWVVFIVFCIALVIAAPKLAPLVKEKFGSKKSIKEMAGSIEKNVNKANDKIDKGLDKAGKEVGKSIDKLRM